ncbi:MAG: T9SS type A sorting domain-containing protein [Bacteroidetes bacterium]|nr:T9SS type A sorting domain-containing protein [Bacteroidota bacterium]
MRKLFFLPVFFVSIKIFAQPCGLTLLVLSTYSAPCGYCNSSIWVGNSGAQGPVTYAWVTGQTTDSITALCPGNYICTVTDSANCTSTGTITITSTPPPTITITTTDVSCDSCCDGTATATASGGTPPYTYLWSDNQTTATATGLCAEKLICCVTDANGCSTCDSLEVFSITGIKNNSVGENLITVFPDPVQDEIFFSQRADIFLADGQGRIIYSAKATDHFYVNELSPGIYFIVLSSGTKVIARKKIIKY